jgi:N-acetylglucosamine-6-sulfatase
VLGLLCASIPTGVPRAAAAGPTAPNIVLILTDDQRWDTLWSMPNVQQELVANGVTFANGYVVNPVCCPSRATILTGEYSHTTGVYTNVPGKPYGGFPAFHDGSTIATWLHDDGYRTGLFGKYLNGYSGTYVPPGWDRWFTTYNHGGYYGYTATDDGAVERFGNLPEDYGTTVLDDRATAFIHDTPSGQPLFLFLAPHAPHDPATPAPGDETAFSELAPWRPPSYDEADVSDKPAYIRSVPPLSADRQAAIDAFRRNQYRSLLAVDRAVGDVVTALRDTGRLQDTLLVFTSDNGMLWGEHRETGKSSPYEESVRVPFVVRWDAAGILARTDRHLVLNLDLAPTFAAAAGVDAPGAEGVSLVQLLADPSLAWRHDFLIEHLDVDGRGAPTFCAVHTRRSVYVAYGTGGKELYDLRNDPYELTNVVRDDTYRPLRRRLLGRLRELCQPPPPGYVVP